MSKTYRVFVHFEGCIEYKIRANSEEEAKQDAEMRFAEEDAERITNQIVDYEACDAIANK